MLINKVLNEQKIYEIAEQAGITFTDYGSGEFLDKDDIDTDRLEKFAELIIKDACTALNPMLRDQISRGYGVDLINQCFQSQE